MRHPFLFLSRIYFKIILLAKLVQNPNNNTLRGGLKFGSVHIFGIFTDDAFTSVACVCSQRKHAYILIDTRVKRSVFPGMAGSAGNVMRQK